jgi:hypothetical protein
MKRNILILAVLVLLATMTTMAEARGRSEFDMGAEFRVGEKVFPGWLRVQFGAELHFVPGLDEMDTDPHGTAPLIYGDLGLALSPVRGLNLFAVGLGGSGGIGQMAGGARVGLDYTNPRGWFHLETPVTALFSDRRPDQRLVVQPLIEFRAGAKHQWRFRLLGTAFWNDDDPHRVYEEEKIDGNATVEDEAGNKVKYVPLGWGNRYFAAGGGVAYGAPLHGGEYGVFEFAFDVQGGWCDGQLLEFNASPPHGYEPGVSPNKYQDQTVLILTGTVAYTFGFLDF